MTHVIEINEEIFQAEVLEAGLPVLVEFGAVWCGPCKMLEPIVEELAAEWDGRVKVVRLDVDHSPNIAMQYQVMSVPTLMLFIDGQPQQRLTGYMPKNKIVDKLSQSLDL